MTRRAPWPARIVWLAVAVVAPPALSGALAGRASAIVWSIGIEAWVLWTAGFVSTLVPRSTSLTVFRLVAPVAPVAAVVAGLAGADLAPTAVFAAVATAAVVVAVAGPTTDAFVDGSSYGSERRLALRVPPLLALAPVPLSWLVAASGTLVVPFLAAGAWVVAGALAAVAAAGTLPAVRSLHQLSRRWLVFVPAGVVVHDPLVLADAVLLPRRSVDAIGPAPADTSAQDLTQHALGLLVEIRLTEPFGLTLRAGRGRAGTEVQTDRLLVAPLRPAALFDAATEARVPVA